jgi:leucyl aminopeptidase (aminopeptidase T)
MDPRIIQMIKYCRVPFELNMKSGQSALIVADTETHPLVWEALAAAAQSVGIEPTVTIMPPREAHGHEPTAAVAAAMNVADATFFVTTRALAHAEVKKEAQARGKLVVLMEEVTPEMLSGGAVSADYAAMGALGARVLDAWAKCKTVRVTSDRGTDLTASVAGRKPFCIAGKAFKDPARPDLGGVCAFPDGEAGIAPVEGTGEGTVVFDTTVHSIGLLRESIMIRVRKGRISSIEGGREAELLHEIIARHGDDQSYNFPAEISIGLNSAAQITGIMRVDKKLYGSVHIALGTNDDFGGTVHSRLHLDGLIRFPTVTMDGKIVVERGKVTV